MTLYNIQNKAENIALDILNANKNTYDFKEAHKKIVAILVDFYSNNIIFKGDVYANNATSPTYTDIEASLINHSNLLSINTILDNFQADVNKYFLYLKKVLFSIKFPEEITFDYNNNQINIKEITTNISHYENININVNNIKASQNAKEVWSKFNVYILSQMTLPGDSNCKINNTDFVIKWKDFYFI